MKRIYGFSSNKQMFLSNICQEANFWIMSIDLFQHLPQAVYFIKTRWAPYLNFCQYASVKKYLECSLWKLDIPSNTSTTLPSSHRDQMTIVTKQVMPGSFFYIHQFKGPRSHKWEESLVQREMFARGRQTESEYIY